MTSLNTTVIEATAFYNDGPGTLDHIGIGDVPVRFSNEDEMCAFFSWLAKTFKTPIEVEVTQQLLEFNS